MTSPPSQPLKFTVIAKWNKARVGKLELPHHICDTPMFMPVGTQGMSDLHFYFEMEDIMGF
jgi:tRNA-guanine family transglycosylase